MNLIGKTTGIIMLCMGLLFINNIQAANGGPNLVNYSTESFEIAKELANNEGKLFFVDFYANWCTPCKWMDKTTFQDKEVTETLNANYVSLKVDIDTKEGFSLKEKYQIKVLPTILIFNSDGELVERIEETLSRSKMMNFLSFHIQSDTRVVQNHYFNQSPNQAQGINKKTNPNTQDQYNTYREGTIKKSIYRVQLGHYDDYTNALTKVNEIREQFLEEIIVLNDYRDGAVWYRVLMGRFLTPNEAEDFQYILEANYNIASVVY